MTRSDKVGWSGRTRSDKVGRYSRTRSDKVGWSGRRSGTDKPVTPARIQYGMVFTPDNRQQQQ